MKLTANILLIALVLTVWSSLRLGWSWTNLASGTLTVAVLAMARRSMPSTSPLRATGILLLLYAGIFVWGTFIEAAAFRMIPGSEALTGSIVGTAVAAVIAGLVAFAFGPDAAETRSDKLLRKAGWWWRVALLPVVFIAFYFAAGAAVYPWIREFYAGRVLPTVPELIRLQYSRGLLYVGLSLPFLCRFAGSRAQAAGALALIYATLGGWAPLLLTDRFPPSVRLAHAVEIGVVNCLFGITVAIILLSGGREKPLGESRSVARTIRDSV